MEHIKFERLSAENFFPTSLDEFERHEEITHTWKKTNGEYVLTENRYTMDWDLEKRRETAAAVYHGILSNGFGYAAFCEGKVAGFIYVCKDPFGSENQYIELKLFYTSRRHRGMGIGSKLFSLACEEARACGAKKLYISSGPTQNTQAAYRKLGCVYAEEINNACVEKYPLDVQLEYLL